MHAFGEELTGPWIYDLSTSNPSACTSHLIISDLGDLVGAVAYLLNQSGSGRDKSQKLNRWNSTLENTQGRLVASDRHTS